MQCSPKVLGLLEGVMILVFGAIKIVLLILDS